MKFLRQIRVRLMLWYFATIVVLVIGVATFAYLRLSRYAYRYSETLLRDEVSEANTVLDSKGFEALEDEIKTQSKLGSRHSTYYTVYDEAGNVMVNTFDASPAPFSTIKVQPGGDPAFDTQRHKDENFRIITAAIRDKNGARYFVRIGRSVKPETKMLENLTENLVIFVPGILFISVIVGWMLARASLRPMKRLSQEASRITEERLNERLPVRGVGDEIDQHAEVLNRMLAGLENSFAEIKTFAARASHELRTPLTALRLQIESALSAQPPEARATLESALNNLDRLASLVQKLLFLTRSKGEAADMKFTRLDFSELVAAVCTDAALLAEQKSLRLNVNIADGAHVMGEPALLAQMAWNLIDNAIKYSPAGKGIDVSVDKRDARAAFLVKDNGPGIPPEDLPHVFDAFFRSGCHPDVPGFGLGLNISKWICEIHHGSIELTNNPDLGATAQVLLPLSAKN
jgi:signal transduction histidine kinase